MFQIEDEFHAEPQKGTFDSYEVALDELKLRAEIPWNKEPNRCPREIPHVLVLSCCRL